MKILVVDDEKLARERLLRLLEKNGEHDVVGEAADGRSAISQVELHHPDIVLMDIRMPGMDGLEAARHLMKLEDPPAIIFCTAYGEHALEAFQTHAMGYLLKPVKAEQLSEALASATRLNRAQLQTISGTGSESAADEKSGNTATRVARQHISARTRHGLELVPVQEVRCFLADHKYVTVYHSKGELLIDDTLKDLEDEFGDRFVRVHRNALVSLPHVEGMERAPLGHYCLRLQGTTMKPVISRRHVTELRNQLKML
ncbi:MAG TPA: LytTR family DNA-binding domain-containing protein [Pseudomonadales bacterium]|nr:LytTR family DNA-binding domain-containing protein [Pseudomonadales bacterium]